MLGIEVTDYGVGAGWAFDSRHFETFEKKDDGRCLSLFAQATGCSGSFDYSLIEVALWCCVLIGWIL